MATIFSTRNNVLVNISGDGGLTVIPTSKSPYVTNGSAWANNPRSTGSLYWEFYVTKATNAVCVGVSTHNSGGDGHFTIESTGWGFWSTGYKTNSNVFEYYGGDGFETGDYVGVYFDIDSGDLGFTVNGVDQGIAYAGLSGTFYAAVGMVAFETTVSVTANFGATDFEYDAPDGYQPFGGAYYDSLDLKLEIFSTARFDRLDGKAIIKDSAEVAIDGKLRVYSAPIHDVTKYRIDLRQLYLRHTPRAQILNTFSARYNRDWSGYEDEYQSSRALVTATDATSVTNYGTLEGEQEALNYVTSAGHAQAVIDWRKEELANPRLLVEFVGGYWLTQFRRGDLFRFSFESDDELDKALLGLVENEVTAFRVIDMVRRNDAAIQIQGIQVI